MVDWLITKISKFCGLSSFEVSSKSLSQIRMRSSRLPLKCDMDSYNRLNHLVKIQFKILTENWCEKYYTLLQQERIKRARSLIRSNAT